jgi:dTDP-4-amino-4,6-dideoxygalactose transaminase
MEHVKFLDLKPTGHLAGLLNVSYDRVFNSGEYIGGKEVSAFEEAWSTYCQSLYCLGTGNGSDALTLACLYYRDIYEIDWIYVPWKTCLPTWASVYKSGMIPSFNLKMDYYAYMAVHIYGKITLPSKSGKILIEDCAQAHGAKLNGVQAGKFGNVACFSFYPTKNLGALGDAGAITTDDVNIYDYIKSMRNYGTRNDTGMNSRLDPLQAAFLRVKLPYLNEWNEKRKANAETYLRVIEPREGLKLPTVKEGEEPCWHIFAIEVKDRDKLKEYLINNNVETMIHYPQVPYPSEYKNREAEKWVKMTLSLPIANVTPYICSKIANLINDWREE